MDNLDHILVLKTNIQTKEELDLVGNLMTKHPKIMQWNIDLEDVDRVLRIVSETLSYAQIAELFRRCGYFCCELD